jgi:hypothetical protein
MDRQEGGGGQWGTGPGEGMRLVGVIEGALQSSSIGGVAEVMLE